LEDGLDEIPKQFCRKLKQTQVKR